MKNKAGKRRYPYLWALLYGVFLTGYAVFTLLDAFVLPKDLVYIEDMEGTLPAMETDGSEAYDNGMDSSVGENKKPEEAAEPEVEETVISEQREDTEPIITDTGYESDYISIAITTQRAHDTQIYIADVTIKDRIFLISGQDWQETLSEGM